MENYDLERFLKAQAVDYASALADMRNGRKSGHVWPLIVDQRLIHLTPHMFPCRRSHSWISGGDQFFGQKTVGVSLRYY